MKSIAEYNDFLKEEIGNFEFGEPIFIRKLTNKLKYHFGIDKKYAEYVLIQNLTNNGAIRKYSNAIYYKVRHIQAFGETCITTKTLIWDKYINPDKGYETGYMLLHKIGLTSLMPANINIVTNNVKGYLYDVKLDVYLEPPKVKVTEDNKFYLQFLDVLEFYNEALIDSREPLYVIKKFLSFRQLCMRKLRKLARKHYKPSVVEQLALLQ